MRFPSVLLPVLLVAALPTQGAGQAPLVLDVRGGVAVPVATGESGPATKLEAGASYGLHLAFLRGPRSAFYVGFTQHRFGCGQGTCAEGGALVSTGWDVGTRLAFPLGALVPWIRLGVVFDRVEGDFGDFGGATAPVRRVSDLAAGAEAGIGAVAAVGGRFSVNPGVRYTVLNTRFPEEGLLRMRYLVADLGIVIGF